MTDTNKSWHPKPDGVRYDKDPRTLKAGEAVRDAFTGRLMGHAVADGSGMLGGSWECGKGHTVSAWQSGCPECSKTAKIP